MNIDVDKRKEEGGGRKKEGERRRQEGGKQREEGGALRLDRSRNHSKEAEREDR